MKQFRAWLARIQEKKALNWAVCAAAVLALPLAWQAVIEFIRSGSLGFTLEYLWIHRSALAPGYLVLLAAFALLAFAFRRAWVPALALGALLWASGFANLAKLSYRGDPFMPNDLAQVAEAVGISGEIRLPFTREMVLGLVFLAVSVLALLPFRLPLGRGRAGWAARIGVPVLCAVFIPVFTLGYIGNRDLMQRRHNVAYRFTSMAETYYQNTFVTGFLFLAAGNRMDTPAGYSRDAVLQAAEGVPAGGQRQVDFVVVLLESFYDISAIDSVRFSEPLLANYTRLAKEGVAGTMLTDQYGGGTSNVEFSVLTGFPSSLLPAGSIPYIEYVDEATPALPGYCRRQGYRTVALHPYTRGFYNRHAAYTDLGFDEYYAIEAFGAEDTLGQYVGDEALGRRIIAEYEKSLGAGQPVFIHAVTMQNHSDYNAASYPAEHLVQAASGRGEAVDSMLSAYATGVRDGDAMLGLLADYFRTVDRDVVLLAFGDHQSGLYLDGEGDVLPAVAGYTALEGDDAWLAAHAVPYLMWANFAPDGEAGGQPGQTLAPYMLAPALAQAYGLQVPAWFDLLAGTRTATGGYAGGYHIAPEGTISTQATPEQAGVLERLRLLEYDLLFGKQYALDTLYE